MFVLKGVLDREERMPPRSSAAGGGLPLARSRPGPPLVDDSSFNVGAASAPAAADKEVNILEDKGMDQGKP